MVQEADLLTKLLPSIFVLGGVLVGGLITFLTTSYQQRKQNDRLEYQLQKQYEKEIFAQGVSAGIEDFKFNYDAAKLRNKDVHIPSVEHYIVKQIKIMRLIDKEKLTNEELDKIIEEGNKLI